MQGKKSFTKSDADAIRELLREKSRADRTKQKTIRGKIRSKYGFYISDFTFSSDAFTHSEFDRLIQIGRIKIIDEDVTQKISPIIIKQKIEPEKTKVSTIKNESTKNNIDKITWGMCQELSDVILADGLKTLKDSKKLSFYDTFSREYGNYLISHLSIPYYIGESKVLRDRIKQHSKEGTSTFYKNYQKMLGFKANLKINDFDIQLIETTIGRKEIEEFGIVNLPTKLNKFQKGKRKRFTNNPSPGIWLNVQESVETLLIEGENALFEIDSINWYDAIIPDNAGLYYVENKDDGLIYIGESSNILDRYNTHSGTTYFSALRRHIGTDCLGFELKSKNNKKRYFTDKEDSQVDTYLGNCTIKGMAVNFGRFELEEYLIRKHKPLLNRKENK